MVKREGLSRVVERHKPFRLLQGHLIGNLIQDQSDEEFCQEISLGQFRTLARKLLR